MNPEHGRASVTAWAVRQAPCARGLAGWLLARSVLQLYERAGASGSAPRAALREARMVLAGANGDELRCWQASIAACRAAEAVPSRGYATNQAAHWVVLAAFMVARAPLTLTADGLVEISELVAGAVALRRGWPEGWRHVARMLDRAGFLAARQGGVA